MGLRSMRRGVIVMGGLEGVREGGRSGKCGVSEKMKGGR